MNNNNILFHGSMHLSAELVPGFVANGGILKEYENGLTNEWFYASPEKVFALQMGLCNLIEEAFKGYHYMVDDIAISADVLVLPTSEDLNEFMKKQVYLYSIPKKSRMWKSVPCSIYQEVYTEYAVTGLFGIEAFTVFEILSLYNTTILFACDRDIGDDQVETDFIELNAYSNSVTINNPL